VRERADAAAEVSPVAQARKQGCRQRRLLEKEILCPDAAEPAETIDAGPGAQTCAAILSVETGNRSASH
jgi:hypothetical protein